MAHIHFVGFCDDSFNRAMRIWGKPHFIHQYWDIRASQEVQSDDVVVFASKKDWDRRDNPSLKCFDDSSVM